MKTKLKINKKYKKNKILNEELGIIKVYMKGGRKT